MGFWSGLGAFLETAAKAKQGDLYVDILLGSTKYGARRQLQDYARTLDDDEWWHLVQALDWHARKGRSAQSEFLGELAEYANELSVKRSNQSRRKS